MASTFVIACPDCGKQIKVSEEVIGKKIRCKECGGVFPVKNPKETAPAKKTPAKTDAKAKPQNTDKVVKKSNAELSEEDDDGKNPYALAKSDEGVARCPNCVKELESPDAKICLHCGFDMEKRKRHEVKAIYEPTGAEKLQWLLPGILAALGVVVLVTISVLVWLNTVEWMLGGWFDDDENGKHNWLIKPGCFKFFNVVVAGFCCYHLSMIAYRRLVLNNKPPERAIEKRDEDGEDD